MSKILLMVGEFLGSMLKHLIPVLLKESKKPRKTRIVGNDEALQNDIRDSIDGEIGRDRSSGQ